MVRVNDTEVIQILRGRPYHVYGPWLETVIVCEGVRVARTRALDVVVLKYGARTVQVATHVACTSPAHGAHPRFQKKLDRVRVLLKQLGKEQPRVECDKCDDGWFRCGTLDATYVLQLAESFGVYRGIKLGIEPKQNVANPMAEMQMVSSVLGAFTDTGVDPWADK